AELARIVAALPDAVLVVIDGLVASTAASVVVPQVSRLRLVVLVHLPLECPGEADVLGGAAGVVTTSEWSRRRLLSLYPLPAGRVVAARPGVDPAPARAMSAAGTRLLSVAAVAPHKGQDVLVAALRAVSDLPWGCVCIGPVDRDPAFVARVRTEANPL